MRPPLHVRLRGRQRLSLQQILRHSRCPRTRLRAQMVLLCSRGYPPQEIARITRHGDDTVRHWLHRFQHHGCLGLREQPRPGRHPSSPLPSTTSCATGPNCRHARSASTDRPGPRRSWRVWSSGPWASALRRSASAGTCTGWTSSADGRPGRSSTAPARSTATRKKTRVANVTGGSPRSSNRKDYDRGGLRWHARAAGPARTVP